MIQLWLAKNGVKLGIIGAILALVFSAGFYVKGKLDSAKILRLKNQVSILKVNYDHALTQNKTCLENNSVLLEELQKQNDAIDALYKATVEKERLIHANYRKVLEAEGSRQAEIKDQYKRDLEALSARLASLSEAEACHEAWASLLEE